jgi:hypothetical protein
MLASGNINGRKMMTTEFNELNEALKMAVDGADGDAEMFAFLLTAPIAGWLGQGMLDEDTALSAIQLLHQLHPNVTV